jgi:CRISPR-associated endoribonuclease Cas6
MSFKKGDFHYPLPESSLVFSNLARRWNLNSPIALPEQPDCEKLTYAFFNIKTVPYSLRKSGTVLGAVGKVVFLLKCSENEKKYFHTLLRFAFYSGIGVKTTQGMGMCRIVGEE